ncbi:MAG: hypothetical protein HRU43_00245 [Simkaniaceae bacterium]|nr:hypothetical protein [Simkaniaceae bacterium]
MEIKTTLKLLLTLVPCIVSGCSTYQESFDCPVGEGVRCASLSTINNKIDRGEIIIEDEPKSDHSVSYGSEFAMGLMG